MIPDRFLFNQPGADALAQGHYVIQRRRAERVDIPVRIWFGAPVDEDGEPGATLDRSPRWQIMIAGMLLGEDPVSVGGLRIECLSDIWPACAAEPIDEAEYTYRIERAAWAAQYDPLDPFAQPGGKIDPMTAPLPFMENA